MPRESWPSIGMTGTLVDCLRWRAQHQPDRWALSFLQDGEDEARCCTYAALDHEARVIAHRHEALTY